MMSGLGSGNNGEWTFLDIVGLVSLGIGLQNLDLNVTQEDAQNLEHQLNQNVNLLLNELHGHLEIQDKKIDEILRRLDNDNSRNI